MPAVSHQNHPSAFIAACSPVGHAMSASSIPFVLQISSVYNGSLEHLYHLLLLRTCTLFYSFSHSSGEDGLPGASLYARPPCRQLFRPGLSSLLISDRRIIELSVTQSSTVVAISITDDALHGRRTSERNRTWMTIGILLALVRSWIVDLIRPGG